MFRLLRPTIFSFEVFLFSSLDALTPFSVLIYNADFSRLTSFRAVQCIWEARMWNALQLWKWLIVLAVTPCYYFIFLLLVSIKKHFVKSSFWRCLFFTGWHAWAVRLHWSGPRLVGKIVCFIVVSSCVLGHLLCPRFPLLILHVSDVCPVSHGYIIQCKMVMEHVFRWDGLLFAFSCVRPAPTLSNFSFHFIKHSTVSAEEMGLLFWGLCCVSTS